MTIEHSFKPIQSSARECFAYMGEREGWLIVAGQSRDSSTLERSNFRSILRLLGGEDDDRGVSVERFNHWAVGWVESILIRPDAEEMISRAMELTAKLEDYPVVDEDDWSSLEWDEACETWERASLSERLDYIRNTDVSIFAIRRAEIPQDDSGMIRGRLSGY